MRYSSVEIENLRRSAAMAPLPQATVNDLLAAFKELALEHERAGVLLTELNGHWAGMRTTLNALAREVGQPANAERPADH